MAVCIIIAGSRNFDDYEMLSSVLDEYMETFGINREKIRIISGRAKGADILGEKYANEKGIQIIVFPADWKKYGRAAGPVRNKQMAEFAVSDGNKGVLFAFWDGISKGTKSMISLAEKYGLEVHITRF